MGQSGWSRVALMAPAFERVLHFALMRAPLRGSVVMQTIAG